MGSRKTFKIRDGLDGYDACLALSYGFRSYGVCLFFLFLGGRYDVCRDEKYM